MNVYTLRVDMDIRDLVAGVERDSLAGRHDDDSR